VYSHPCQRSGLRLASGKDKAENVKTAENITENTAENNMKKLRQKAILSKMKQYMFLQTLTVRCKKLL